MDGRPIGVFDSGVGGLSALRALRELAPREKVIYFGDSGRMPYGTRPREEIISMALQDVRFLEKLGVKALLAACNTIDSNALPQLREASAVPVLGVVRPAAKEAAELTKSGSIGVICTPATERSGAYAAALAELSADFSVCTVGCPRLAELAERGCTSLSDAELAQALDEYLAPVKAAGADVLVLGCTHYPLLAGAISELLPGVSLVDSGAAGARALLRQLKENGALSEGCGGDEFYTSGETGRFAAVAQLFLGRSVGERLSPITLD